MDKGRTGEPNGTSLTALDLLHRVLDAAAVRHHRIWHSGRMGDAHPLVTARDGLRNLRVIEAIVEAAKSGRVVDTRRLYENQA